MPRQILMSALLKMACAATLTVPLAGPARAQSDLATQVAGTWRGDVTADARGSSQSGVTVTVRRVDTNVVEVSSDYSRLPTVRVPISRAGNAIVQSNGNVTFLVELNRNPDRLDLYIDGAALVVNRN